MTAFETVRNLIKNQALFTSTDYLNAEFGVIVSEEKAIELMTSQVVGSPYRIYDDFTSGKRCELYLHPSEAVCAESYTVYQHALELVDLWLYVWDSRDYGEFIDQLLSDLSSIIECEAKFGCLDDYWADVLRIYVSGAMPCGICDSGQLVVHKLDVSEVILSSLGRKRKAYELKKKAKRLEEIESCIQ